MSAILGVNILLMIVFFGLWVGVPAWLFVRHPDRAPRPAMAPAIRRVPQPREDRSGHRRVA